MVWKGLWCWIRILESSSASLQGWIDGVVVVVVEEEQRRILVKKQDGREKCEGKINGGRRGRANLSSIVEDTSFKQIRFGLLKRRRVSRGITVWGFLLHGF